MPIIFTLKDTTSRKARFSPGKLSLNARNTAVLSYPLTEFKTTWNNRGHCLLSCANQGREAAYFLISSFSVVVVGRENLPTKILALWKYQRVYKQMAAPHEILSSLRMLPYLLNLFQCSPEQAALLAKVRKVRNGSKPTCAYKSSKFITLD